MATQAPATLSKAAFERFSVQLKELSSEMKEISKELHTKMVVVYELASRLFALPTKDLSPFARFYNVTKWAIFDLSDKPLASQSPEETLHSAFLCACLIAARETANADEKAAKVDYDTRVENTLKEFVTVKKGSLKAKIDFSTMKADPFWAANPELLKTTADLYGHKESSCILA